LYKAARNKSVSDSNPPRIINPWDGVLRRLLIIATAKHIATRVDAAQLGRVNLGFLWDIRIEARKCRMGSAAN
jgi:hypothetical protein